MIRVPKGILPYLFPIHGTFLWIGPQLFQRPQKSEGDAEFCQRVPFAARPDSKTRTLTP